MFSPEFRIDEAGIVDTYRAYMATQLDAGVKLNVLTKHLLHSFNGRPGARRFRQILSDAKRLKSNDLSLVDEAMAALMPLDPTVIDQTNGALQRAG
jgi:tRNA-dihydrouridine synthase A